jgi:hypothetical protein
MGWGSGTGVSGEIVFERACLPKKILTCHPGSVGLRSVLHVLPTQLYSEALTELRRNLCQKFAALCSLPFLTVMHQFLHHDSVHAMKETVATGYEPFHDAQCWTRIAQS